MEGPGICPLSMQHACTSSEGPRTSTLKSNTRFNEAPYNSIGICNRVRTASSWRKLSLSCGGMGTRPVPSSSAACNDKKQLRISA
jgi:hypothetical protein